MQLADPETAFVNRSAVVVRPKQPYLDWATELDETPTEQTEALKHSCTVYLAPEVVRSGQLDRWVRRNCPAIFEHELWAWCRDADAWPEDRGHRAFRAWFSVAVTELVIDLGREPIEAEVL